MKPPASICSPIFSRSLSSAIRCCTSASTATSATRSFTGDAAVSFHNSRLPQAYVQAGEVNLLPREGVALRRDRALAHRHDRSLPPAAQALIAIIRDHRKAAEPAAEAAAS